MRISRFALLALGLMLAGCGRDLPTQPQPIPEPRETQGPTAGPTPPAEPKPVETLVYTDPVTGMKTSDVLDLHGQVVQFNTAGDLIWAADGVRFTNFPAAYGYERGAFGVEFATENGERRAFLTFDPAYWHYPPPPSRVDLDVVDGTLVIRHPDPPVFLPGT